MDSSVGVIIATVEERKSSLIHTLQHLIQFIQDPLTIYIYNDAGSPISEVISKLKASIRSNVNVHVLNDRKEISKKRIGCGGARHHLFERAKLKHKIIISLDDDMQITANWYPSIKLAITNYPNHSLFTGVVKHPNQQIQAAGAKIKLTKRLLQRIPIRNVRSNYHLADWAPLGCVVLCRKALQKKVKIPPLFVKEDAAFLLELRRHGIISTNQTVVATKAVAIHRTVSVSSNLRIPAKMKQATKYIKRNYGVWVR